jgi:hypothetical protein
MQQDKLLELIIKVEAGEASVEEKNLVLKEFNMAADEYISLLKKRVEELS